MTDRAISLFRTVLHPVLSTLRLRAGRRNLPVAPHHAVPALNLSGLILARPASHETPAGTAADDMYGGIYAFAGERVEALPDTVFTCPAPSPAWRSGLLGFSWLNLFRSSGRPLHGLFALRLVSAWMKANPPAQSHTDQISALFNLAVDAPAIASQQSPAAIAVATAAILRAQAPVTRIKPASAREAFDRAAALLAAHLATRRGDGLRSKLVTELTDALALQLMPDGSLRDGSVDDLCRLHLDLSVITDGLARSGDGVPTGLSILYAGIGGYLALLARADGTLAFADSESLKSPPGVLPPSGSALAEHAGYARLSGGATLLLAAISTPDSRRPLRLEMSDAGKPVLWLEQVGGTVSTSGFAQGLICAAGGTLLELREHSTTDGRQHLALFLASDGSDLRLEDTTQMPATAAWLLHVPEQTKLSTTNGGTGAMIVPATGQPWQVLVRGGVIEMENGCFRIVPDAATPHALNFALKRAVKTERAVPRGARSRERPAGNPRLL